MSVSFALFRDAVKDRLTQEQLAALNPDFAFYEHAGAYFSFGCSDGFGKTWISMAAGSGPRWFWEFRRMLIRAGCPQVGWSCKPDSPSHRIAVYYKADIKDTGERYADGASVLECWVDLTRGRHG